MTLELTDEQAAALIHELHEIVDNDRYPFSPRIRTLREILNQSATRTGTGTAPRAEAL